MANQLPPGASTRTVQGPIHAVPCPHCGKPNDYRTLKSEQLLDTGHCNFCDYCGHSMEVVKLATIEIVVVRRDPSGKVAPARSRAQAAARQRQIQQQKPGFFQRLLGKG